MWASASCACKWLTFSQLSQLNLSGHRPHSHNRRGEPSLWTSCLVIGIPTTFPLLFFFNFYIIRSGKYIFTRTLWLQVSGRKVWLNVFFDFLNFFSIFKHFSVWLDTGSDFFLVVTFEFHLLIWSGISLICEKCQLLLTAVATTLRPPCAVSQTHVALIGLDFFFCFLILQPASSLSYCVQMRSRRAISL